MAVGDLPSMMSSYVTSQSLPLQMMAYGGAAGVNHLSSAGGGGGGGYGNMGVVSGTTTNALGYYMAAPPPIQSTVIVKPKETEVAAANGKAKLRVVRVFLVDPDERVPLENRVLHRTDEMTTDAVDMELFHELPVMELLRAHNKLRQSIRHKDDGAKEAEALKEIRIRDLVMSVTTIAEFQARP